MGCFQRRRRDPSARCGGPPPLFVAPEAAREGGLLPAEAAEPVRTWLRSLATDKAARSAVVRQTLDGAVASLSGRVADLATAADAQADALMRLRRDAAAA